jgi:hypothetical protein
MIRVPKILIQKFYKNWFYILLIFLIVQTVDSCEGHKKIQSLNSVISNLDIENQKFKTELNKKDEKVISQAQIIISQKEAIRNGLIEIDKLKKIKSKVKIVTETKVDTVYIEYYKTIIDSLNQEPFDYKNYFDYQEPKGWYSINGYATNLGIGIDSLRVKNDFSIYIADKKLNIFGKSNPEVILLNKNPYTETIKMHNIVIRYEQPFYNNKYLWAGVGFVGGVLLAK